jgi:uncharacterized membrane protein
MGTPASFKNHPLHPILVSIPIGLWTFAFVCDLIHAFGGSTLWSTVSLYCVAGGSVGAVVAAVPGLIDYFFIDEADMKRIATTHLLVNLGAVVIFTVNLWARFHVSSESFIPLILSAIGMGAVAWGGWLGGEMVYVKGMAVEAVEELTKKENRRPKLRRAS